MNTSIQTSKNSLYAGLKHLQTLDYRFQPWMNVAPSQRREVKPEFAGKRIGINGNPRCVSLSDFKSLATCERMFAASYSGEKLMSSDVVYVGKGGTILHTFIESNLPQHIETEQNSKTWVFLPNLGERTTAQYSGKRYSGVGGKYDGFIPATDTGLEFKVVPKGQELPTELSEFAKVQGAMYMKAILDAWKNEKTPEYWAWVYFPQDMNTFRANDMDTYRVFYTEKDELMSLAEETWSKALNVARVVDEHGFWGAWDYLECSEEDCRCKTAQTF